MPNTELISEERDEQRPAAPPPPPETESEQGSFIRRHPVKALLGLIILIAVAAGGFMYWQYSQTFEETDDAQIDGHLNTVSSRIPGTIVHVYVEENQEVQAGQLLFDLDPRDYQVALEQARAGLTQAQAQIQVQAPSVSITSETTQTGIASAQAELATAEASVAAAEQEYQSQLAQVTREEANNARAQADLQRYTTLVQKDEVSRQEYDQRVAAARAAAATLDAQRAAARAAQRAVEQRRAVITQAEARLGEVRANAPRQVSIQQANVALRNAGAQAARAQIAEAELNLQYTKVYAPVGGVIGRKSAELGMRVQPGQQLVSIIPLNDIWVTANFKENQLRRMRVKQHATIHVDALDRDFEGYVESMPAATAARYSILPPENASGNYVKVVQRLPVRLRFNDPKSAHGDLRPGMSVVPKIWFH